MEESHAPASGPAQSRVEAYKPVPARRLASLLSPTDGDVERKLAERRAAGGDVINLAVVEPELPPPPEALEQLSARRGDATMVRGAGGITEYRAAVVRWYQSRFKTSLDPNREVLPLPSVEDGITGLAQLLLEPDDLVLVPDPARPIYQAALATVGARSFPLPLRPEQDFLPEIKSIPPETAVAARMLWLDYPNQPTGAVAPAGFFHQVVQFAHEHHVLVVHVADFSEFTYEGYRTISLMEIPGARRVCVELHSPAQTFNLPAWPGAVAVGNADVLRLLRQLRQHLQQRTFVPVQRALSETMMLAGADWLGARNAVYQTRRDQAATVFEHAGLQVRRPRAVPALWLGVPAGYTSLEVADLLLTQANVWVAPGANFGPHGEGYIQVSLTIEETRFQEALNRLRAVVIPPKDVLPPAEADDPAGAPVEASGAGTGEEQNHAG